MSEYEEGGGNATQGFFSFALQEVVGTALVLVVLALSLIVWGKALQWLLWSSPLGFGDVARWSVILRCHEGCDVRDALW